MNIYRLWGMMEEYMDALLEWPTPPYFKDVAVGAADQAETCVLYLRDGRKILGELLQFSPQATQLVFLPTRDEASETIALDRIKSVRLVKPLMLKPQSIALEKRTEEIHPPSERQQYTVEFKDKETLRGETLGYANTANGLYLFSPGEDKKIIRSFIPHLAMEQFQIGPFIGEMLVEDKLASKAEVDAALDRQRELRVQRIGDYLSEHQIVSRDQLSLAIKHQESQPILKLGEALLQLGLLSEAQLEDALTKQKENRKIQLGQILVGMGVIDERTLKGALAKKLGIPYVSLNKFNFDPNALRLTNASFARRHLLIPLYLHGDRLVVAFENPLDTKAIEELHFMAQVKTIPVMASRDDILSAIGRNYEASSTLHFPSEAAVTASAKDEYAFHQTSDVKIDDLANKLFDEGIELELVEKAIPESDNTLVQLVNKIILDAYQDGVSDIHIETYAGRQNTRVRFRKDGALTPYLEIPPNFRNAVISRIKVMSNLDISERRKPQDGKLDFQHFGPAKIELRVATIPTSSGLEDIVMRILAAAKPVPIDDLGLAEDALEALKRLMLRPYGLILVCGPTGSGKTTTLHSLLGYINTPERKIWTAEDPIEIAQPGLRQVQVNSKIGWTFANAMRSFLRGDPDVIMVGEMRDQETTKVGIEASLTGHLVLSTLHTNTAPESVVRLLDLGMDPFNFSDALLAILAQRLARALCPECKTAHEASATEIDALLAEYCEGTPLDADEALQAWKTTYSKNGKFTLYHPNGCKHCNNTGYRGRMGLHELMVITPEVKKRIQTRAPVSELLHAAIAGGMRTLKQDGILKVLAGRTDIGQIRAVCV
ncbi:MAG TPA: ATPase, T2SS/T4P/T4SS family [Methylophilaceae bacterium]|nr:ATPase, T2SS/T4P/T4SS family [Methylophilaceae bacterium]